MAFPRHERLVGDATYELDRIGNVAGPVPEAKLIIISCSRKSGANFILIARNTMMSFSQRSIENKRILE